MILVMESKCHCQVPPRKEYQAQNSRNFGHQIDENGEVHFLTHKLGEDGFCAEHLPVGGFLSPETLQLIEYCRDNGLMEQLGIFGKA